MKDKTYSILVVDDEPVNVRLLASILRQDYQVQEAYGGAEALAIAHSDNKPALILLDVMMPEIDGFEVCRRLKDSEDTKDIMIIFVTAMGDSAAEEVGLNLGAVDYIAKPLRLPIVRARVRNHMNLRRKADLLEAMSYIDGLTNVYNRRRFDQALIAEWQRARRIGQWLALIMIDFDHFKALNDHYGHGTGDVCLQRGAAALAHTLNRPGDLLARYGGEEFVALLPGTDLTGACAKAEEMRTAIQTLRLAHAYSPVSDHVTISLGVAAAVPNAAMEAGELLELADLALTEAKKAGRNCLRVAPPVTEAALTEVRAWRTAKGAPVRKKTERLGNEAAAGPSEYARSTVKTILAAIDRLQTEPLAEEPRSQLEALRITALRLDALLAPLDTEPTAAAASAGFAAAGGLCPTGMGAAQCALPAPLLSPTVAEVPAAERCDTDSTEAVFAAHDLLARVGQDRDIARETIEQFLLDAPTRLRELSIALAQGATEQIRAKAHSLKGMAGNIAALRLTAVAERVEQAAELAAARAEMPRLQEEYQALEPRLRRWIAQDE